MPVVAILVIAMRLWPVIAPAMPIPVLLPVIKTPIRTPVVVAVAEVGTIRASVTIAVAEVGTIGPPVVVTVAEFAPIGAAIAITHVFAMLSPFLFPVPLAFSFQILAFPARSGLVACGYKPAVIVGMDRCWHGDKSAQNQGRCPE